MDWFAMRRRAFGTGLAVLALVALGVGSTALTGCRDSKLVSERHAREHVASLVEVVHTDVEEVRKGMPAAVVHLSQLFAKEAPREELAEPARKALDRARNKTQDLRVAKSTFFGVTGRDGIVIRTDQEQDRMAGKPLFGAFPGLKQALAGKYVETHGAMAEASGVKGKPDGQWVVAQPIQVNGETRGLYVSGWSWSSYAYRLEFHLRSKLKSALDEYDKMPLIYVFVVVDQVAYGAPVTALVSQQEVGKLDPLSKLDDSGMFTTTLEITGRGYGLAVKAMPLLGERVGIAVLRSET
jgi:hypothetical protein